MESRNYLNLKLRIGAGWHRHGGYKSEIGLAYNDLNDIA